MIAPYLLLGAVAAGRTGGVTAEVPLYLGAELSDTTLERALHEVDQIFEPGGIRFRWTVSPESPPSSPVFTVVILPRPARVVVHGCSRDLHDHRLGHTHLQSRRITLWTEQIARAVDGNWDRPDVPNVHAATFARALGRVLAHELGHLFLRLYGHREGGLMRASFSHRSLTSPSARAFRLSRDDLGRIAETVARYKTRSVATPP